MTTKKQTRLRMEEKRARELEETKASGLAALEKARKLQERKDAQRSIELQQASETMERKLRKAKAAEAMKALGVAAQEASSSLEYIGKHTSLDATGTAYTDGSATTNEEN